MLQWRIRSFVLMGVAVLALLAAVAWRESFGPNERSRIVVTRHDADPVPGCSPLEAGRRVDAFFTAFNSGDREALRRAFVPDANATESEYFAWFGVIDGRENFKTGDRRGALMRYFERRHRKHERLSLAVVRVGVDRFRGIAGLEFIAIRKARDLPPLLGGPDNVAEGKAGLNCAAGTLFMWSMSMEPPPGRRLPEPLPGPCPIPDGWTLRDPRIIACAASPDD